MDLERVYREFIADRLRKQDGLELYETHHIVPRALKGSNSVENLIKLSLNDHLFAHVLLARIHGGPMAVALQNMLRFKRYQGRRSRLQYDRLKRQARLYMSETFTGRSCSEETRELMRKKQLERCADPEKAAQRKAALYTPEAVAKARQGGREYWTDPGRRAAMRGNTRSTGRVLSEVHKERIRAKTTAYWAQRRAAKE